MFGTLGKLGVGTRDSGLESGVGTRSEPLRNDEE